MLRAQLLLEEQKIKSSDVSMDCQVLRVANGRRKNNKNITFNFNKIFK